MTKKCLYFLVIFVLLGNIISSSTGYPKYVNLGVFAEKFTSLGDVNVGGSHSLAAITLALSQLNNKSDGVYDQLLPNTTLRFALRETQSDFLVASLAAQELALQAFGGVGVVGAIGTGYDTSSKAVAQTFANTDYKVCNIDYFANDSELSHSSTFPYFARVVPSRGYGGRILARVIKLHYGWESVSIFSTSDGYGSDISSEFISEATKLGIKLENSYSFWPGTTDFTDIISKTLSNGILKIFVFMMKSPDAGALLEAGYNAGLFKEGTQILGSQFIVKPLAWQSMSADAPVTKIMKGVLSVVPWQNRNHSEFNSFLSAYLAQPSTKIRNKDGSITCNHAKDDDGNTYLYKEDQNSTKCAGVDFSSLSPSGTDLEDMVPLAYDAVFSMALALHYVIYEQQIQNFTGDDLRRAILDYVNFTGATGYIDFFEGLGGVEGYGKGDREAGLTYVVYNFNPDYFTNVTAHQGDAIRVIGFWNDQYHYHYTCTKKMTSLCTPAVYNTWNNEPVDDTPDIVEVQLEDWARNLLRGGGGIGLFTVAMYATIWMLYSDTKIIKVTQPVIMFVVLVGGTMGGVQIILQSVDITTDTCIAGMWIGHMAFAFVFAALLARTWRISKIVKSGFSKVKVSADRMYMFMAMGMFIFFIILIVDGVVGGPHRSYEQYFDGHRHVRLIKCENSNPNVKNALFAIEGLVLFYGAKLCWDSKDAPGSVNDSGSISLALYLILFVCAVTFPIVFLSIEPTPQNLTLVRGSGYIAAVIGVLNIIFANKALLALEGAEVDVNLNIIRGEKAKGLKDRIHHISKNVALKLQQRAGLLSSSQGHTSDNSVERKMPVIPRENVELNALAAGVPQLQREECSALIARDAKENSG